jgi:cysteinyl-tRNA synthetase
LHGKAVGLYTCGPTVYNTPHIGNWRSFLWEDVLRRYLEYKGFKVTHVMNLTDVDDKTIKGSREKGVSLDEFTLPFKKAFFEELKELNAEPATYFPEATKHIPAMVSLVQKLLKNGFAYKAEDNCIYFEIKKFKGYGKLSRFKLKKLKAGARVSQDEYEKQAVSDFALWKAWTPEDGNIFWETPLGKGRPGWHIECSAMSMQYLGESFDIHTGGIDNLFPHHENEIAQSEAATGKPFVKYWLHAKHLLVNGQKMSKSLGNFFRLSDLKQFEPKTIRFALILGHYRKPLDFRLDETQKLDKKRKQLNETIQRLLENRKEQAANPKNKKLTDAFLKRFEESMDFDLNTPKAFAALFDFSKKTNQLLDNGIGKNDADLLLAAFKKADSVFGILNFEPKKAEKLPTDLMRLIQQREELRKQKNWTGADEIRNRLAEKGIELLDTPEGVKWKKSG